MLRCARARSAICRTAKSNLALAAVETEPSTAKNPHRIRSVPRSLCQIEDQFSIAEECAGGRLPQVIRQGCARRCREPEDSVVVEPQSCCGVNAVMEASMDFRERADVVAIRA